jgi:hypothetical protein
MYLSQEGRRGKKKKKKKGEMGRITCTGLSDNARSGICKLGLAS